MTFNHYVQQIESSQYCRDDDYLEDLRDMFKPSMALEQLISGLAYFQAQPHLGKLYSVPNMPCFTQSGTLVTESNCAFNTMQYSISFSDAVWYDNIHIPLCKSTFLDVQRCSVSLVPSCAFDAGRFYYFFVPLAMRDDRNMVILPPFVHTDDLLESSDAFDPLMYNQLSVRYLQRMNDSKSCYPSQLVNKLNSDLNTFFPIGLLYKWNTGIAAESFALSTFVTGDAFDVHVSYYEALSKSTGKHDAVVTGYKTFADRFAVPMEHPFMKLVKFHDAPAAGGLAAGGAESTVKIAQLEAELQSLRLQLDSCKAQLDLKTDDFGKKVLSGIREKFPEVGRYISFTLTNNYIDDEEEVVNWQNRCDALNALAREAKEYLHVQVLHETVDDIVHLDTVCQQIDAQLRETIDGWDIETLKGKFLQLSNSYVELETDSRPYQYLYNFALRSKEEQFALAIKHQREALVTAGPATIFSRAWAALNTACDSIDFIADDPLDAEDTVSPLLLGRYLKKLLQAASEIASDMTLSDAEIANHLLIGIGKDAIDLKDLDSFQVLNSPFKMFYERLQIMPALQELIATPTEMVGISRLDQMLLMTAGKPFLKSGLYHPDETRLFFKNVLRAKPAELKRWFGDDMHHRRWVLEPGDPGY